MIFCRELKKDFSTKQEMFKALKQNKNLIIDSKKAAVKFTDWLDMRVMAVKSQTEKAEGDGPVEIKLGDHVFPVINTTNLMDSHGDVHIDDIWNASVNDQQGKVYYIINHDLEIGKVIAYPEDVEMMIKTMPWTELGRDYEGDTQALIFKVLLTEKGNSDANKAIMNKVALQNSVRMRYIRIKLCVNSTSDYYKEEYANWLQYISRVANKEVAYEEGYFWAVLEAQVYKEGSAVLYGSNEVTPILTSLEEKQTGPSDDSQDKNKQLNPSADSLAKKKNFIVNNLM